MNGPLVLNGKEITANYIHFSDTVSNPISDKIPHPFKWREPFSFASAAAELSLSDFHWWHKWMGLGASDTESESNFSESQG